MKKVLKWIGIVLGGLVGLIVLVVLGLFLVGNAKLRKTHDIAVQPVAIPSDGDSLALGEHRVTMLCTGCHGADLGGVENWFSDPLFGSIGSANLTSGAGGIGSSYQTVEDYVRAIRHGVDPQGKPIYMPAVVAFNHMSDEELGAVIAYLQSVPPVDRQVSEKQLTVMAKAMMATGMMGDLPAEVVDHTARPSAPPAGATAAYGEYMVNISDCKLCHGQQLTGGTHPDPTVQVQVPGISASGAVGGWTAEEFVATIRTGFTPDKRPIIVELMPWKEYALATDEELTAMYLYLVSLP